MARRVRATIRRRNDAARFRDAKSDRPSDSAGLALWIMSTWPRAVVVRLSLAGQAVGRRRGGHADDDARYQPECALLQALVAGASGSRWRLRVNVVHCCFKSSSPMGPGPLAPRHDGASLRERTAIASGEDGNPRLGAPADTASPTARQSLGCCPKWQGNETLRNGRSDVARPLVPGGGRNGEGQRGPAGRRRWAPRRSGRARPGSLG